MARGSRDAERVVTGNAGPRGAGECRVSCKPLTLASRLPGSQAERQRTDALGPDVGIAGQRLVPRRGPACDAASVGSRVHTRTANPPPVTRGPRWPPAHARNVQGIDPEP